MATLHWPLLCTLLVPNTHNPLLPAQDLVLACVAALLVGQGQPLGAAVFQAAAGALAAGAAATTAAGVERAAELGQKRGAAACQQRYAQLCAAAAACSGGKENAEGLLAQLRSQLQQQLGQAGVAPKALAAVQQLLQRGGSGRQAAALAALLQQQLAALLPGAAVPAAPALAPDAAAPLGRAQQLIAAIQQRCGDAASRAITGRLQHILDAGARRGELAV